MASPFARFPCLATVEARGYVAHHDGRPDIVVAIDFGAAFPEYQELISADKAVSASARVVGLAATTAFAFDGRYYQRGDDSVLECAVDQFAFTPAMCDAITAADKRCDTAHVSIVNKRVTCFRKDAGAGCEDIATPSDAHAALHLHIDEFATWMATAERAMAEAESDLAPGG